MKITDVINLGVDPNGVPYLIDQPDANSDALGTVICANLLNPVLAEVFNAIRLSGLEPSSDNTQLYQVLAKITNDIANVQGGVNNINNLAAQVSKLASDLAALNALVGSGAITNAVNQVNALKDQLMALPGVNIRNATTSTLDNYDESYKLNSKFMVAIRLVQKQIYGFISQQIARVNQVVNYIASPVNQYPAGVVHSRSLTTNTVNGTSYVYGGILQSDIDDSVDHNSFMQCQIINGQVVTVLGVYKGNQQWSSWIFNPSDGTITTPTGKVIGN